MDEHEAYEVFRREAYLLLILMIIFGTGLTLSTLFFDYIKAMVFAGLVMWVSGFAFALRYGIRKLIKKKVNG